MNDLEELQKRLKGIAEVVNAFKSEAVQLRVVEVLLGQLGVRSTTIDATTAPIERRLVRRRRPSRKSEQEPSQTEQEQRPTSARKGGRSSGSPGAFAMISQLLGDGFFSTPRTIGSIVAHAGTARGHHYKANECSPALLRLLRDGKLKREKNKDGQYEYTEA